MVKLKQSAIGTWAVSLVALAAIAQPAAKPDASANKGVAATIGGQPVTIEELDAKVLKLNMNLAQQLYDARKAALDEVIMERAMGEEAKAAGITVEQLLQKRVGETQKPVTDAEVEAFFNANQGRMQGKPLTEVAPQIKSMLANQRMAEARTAIINDAKGKAGVKVLLEVPRVEVAIAPNDPMKGNKDAKITIVEFSEFQ